MKYILPDSRKTVAYDRGFYLIFETFREKFIQFSFTGTNIDP